MIGTAHASPAPTRTTAAHRDPNVLRWLTAYTASLLGDSVYFLAPASPPRRWHRPRRWAW